MLFIPRKSPVLQGVGGVAPKSTLQLCPLSQFCNFVQKVLAKNRHVLMNTTTIFREVEKVRHSECNTAIYAMLTNVDILKFGVNLVKSRLEK